MSRMFIRGFTLCAVIGFAGSAHSDTIIKLNLGGIGPDVGMNGAGLLATVDDGLAATTGNQNTDAEFTGFLDVPFPDINTGTASFTVNGISAAGTAQVFGTLVVQNFANGQFSLYDPANALLLQGPLGSSTLTGVIGPPGTGALFTTTLTTVTAGTLAPYITPGTVSLSMQMANVNGGNGFSVAVPLGGLTLNSFLADASVAISADFSGVPEPSTIVLGSLAALGLALARRASRV